MHNVQFDEMFRAWGKYGIKDVSLKLLLGGEKKYQHMNRMIIRILKYIIATAGLTHL